MGASAVTRSTLVLWVGEVPAPESALERVGIEAWSLPPDVSARELVAAAPDLVVLAGASAARAGALVRELAAERPREIVPIAVLGAGADTLDSGGVVAHVAPGQTPEEIASALAAVLMRLQAADARAQRTLDARGIERLAAELVAQRRAALLLRGSPPGALAIAADGNRVSALGARGEESSVVRVYERAPGKLAVLGAGASSEAAAAGEAALGGIAALVIDDGMADWEAVARALEGAGAKVTLADAERGALEEARAQDPALIVVAPAVLATPAGLLVCEDPRLASASLLVVREDPRAELDPARVVHAARQLCCGEIALRSRALAGEPIVARIEALGVVRWLKTFADAGMRARLRLRSAAGRGELRVEGGKIAEATFEPSGAGEAVRGGAAARALLALRRGTILAGPSDAPQHERARPPASAAAQRGGTGSERDAPLHERARPPASAAAQRGADHELEDEITTVAPSAEVRALVARAARESAEPREHAAAPASEPTSPSATTPVEPAHTAPDAPEPALPERTAEPVAPRRRAVAGVAAAIAVLGAVSAAAYVWSASAEGADDPVADTVFAEPPPQDAPTHDAPTHDTPTPDAPTPDAPTPDAPTPDAPTPDAPTHDTPTPDSAPEAVAQTTDAPPREPPAPEAPGASANRIVLAADEALRRREYAEALALAERALALDPGHARATYDRALSLLRLGRENEALEEATRAAQLDREEPLYPLLVGDIHQQFGRRARASAVWRACVEAHPEFEPCQRRLARAEGR